MKWNCDRVMIFILCTKCSYLLLDCVCASRNSNYLKVLTGRTEQTSVCQTALDPLLATRSKVDRKKDGCTIDGNDPTPRSAQHNRGCSGEACKGLQAGLLPLSELQ